jgi:hypothetical protein
MHGKSIASKKINVIMVPIKNSLSKTKPIAEPFWGEKSGPRWGYSKEINRVSGEPTESFAQLVNLSGGMARIGYENEDIGDIYLTGPSGTISLGTSGLDIGGRLITGGITLRSPTIFNHRLEVGLEGNAFGLGITYSRTQEGKFKRGATALFGGSATYRIIKVA